MKIRITINFSDGAAVYGVSGALVFDNILFSEMLERRLAFVGSQLYSKSEQPDFPIFLVFPSINPLKNL